VSLDSAPPYRRRTRWPVLVIVGVLLIGAIIVWTQVLKPVAAAESGCNQPGAVPETSTASSGTGTATSTSASTATSSSSQAVSTTLGAFTTPESLADTRPADPGDVPLTVLNASTVTGQAKTVTDELRAVGFSAMGQQENDPLYPAADLRCYGEIRYGYAGLAEARTTLIVAPCAQLVLDDRLDNSVDLSLGRLYQLTPITDDVKAQLTAIKNASAPPPVIEGQTVSVRSLPPIPPLPDRTGCPA
jgi:hypothetical protein